MISTLVESNILIGKSKWELVNLFDTCDAKGFDFSNNEWMDIIEKSVFTTVTDTPIEVLDYFCEYY